MAYKRYLVEFGTGADLHGMDATKAAIRAIHDAMHHCCLCGLREILGYDSSKQRLKTIVRIASPLHETIDIEEVKKELAYMDAEIEAVAGGLSVRGLEVPALGDGDTILVANAAITVYIDV